jgi:predicted dehydrogenase
VRAEGATQPMAAVRAAFEASLSGGEDEAFFPRGIVDALTIELLDLVTVLRDGRPLEVDGLEGLRDVAVAEAICESDAAHRPVTTADVIEGRIDTYRRPIDEHWRLV